MCCGFGGMYYSSIVVCVFYISIYFVFLFSNNKECFLCLDLYLNCFVVCLFCVNCFFFVVLFI